MAISPIAIATHGLLNSPLSVSAIRGRLTIVSEAGEVIPGPGGGMHGTWEHPFLRMERMRDQILREDEEILAIIMAAMRVIG